MIDETEVIRNEKKSDAIIKNTSIIWNRLGEMIKKSKLMGQSALKITVIYVLIGSGWVLFSDEILSMLSNDPKWIFTLSVLKGWIFVMLTGGILYWLVAHSHKSLQQKNLALTISNERRLASEEELRQQVDELLERDKKIMQQNLVLTSLHNTVFS